MPSTNPDEVTDLAGVKLIPVNSLQPMIKQVSVKLGLGAWAKNRVCSQLGVFFPFDVLLKEAVNC